MHCLEFGKDQRDEMIRIDALHRSRHPGAHRRLGGGLGIAHDRSNSIRLNSYTPSMAST
jgi:hypothetical protein